MVRKDKYVTPSVTQKLQDLGYKVADWDDSSTRISQEVKQVLSSASKKQNDNAGYPDRIYCNKTKKLLILVEEKPDIKSHDIPNIEKWAIAGIKWYLERFMNKNLPNSLKSFFNSWKILWIAVSGDLSVEYQHKFTCFLLNTKNEKIELLNQITNFTTEDWFLAVFNSFDEERHISSISKSSKDINNLLRSIDSQKRPILLSALMICLHKNNSIQNDFSEHYKTYNSKTIITNIIPTIMDILKKEWIPQEKLDTLETELAFLKTDQTLNNSDILKQILKELEENVIPLFNESFATNSNYDILWKFYEEFLKYAGVSNVKKWIVLTPRHITTLFTKLVPLKDDDRIVDLCCWTGAFLIAGMNALLNQINKSNRSDKIDAIKNVKTRQLLGFEVNSTMYICAISSMLFRWDGKSSIYNYDSIKDQRTDAVLRDFRPTIGFINPPYSWKENNTDPTPKEITFLTKLLDNCSRYAVMIAPLSVYFKDDEIRNQILQRHTLKYVINMPKDLFQPNAMTNTAVAVFETNRAFDYENDEVLFYDLKEDGFVLSKNKWRTDVYNKWENFEKDLLDSLQDKKQPDEINFVKTKIKPNDEWTIYAHSKTDYSTLSEDDFIKTISDYMIFAAKKDLGILDEKLTEMEKIEAIGNYFSGNTWINIKTKNERTGKKIDITKWSDKFKVGKEFDCKTTPHLIWLEVTGKGDIPYITRTAFNNWVDDFIEDNEYIINKWNCITIWAEGLFAFYQEEKFVTGVKVYTIRHKKLNKYNALFICSILNKNIYKYSYGRARILDKIKEEDILLPINKYKEIDWEYMENYIKSLPYGDLIWNN